MSTTFTVCLLLSEKSCQILFLCSVVRKCATVEWGETCVLQERWVLHSTDEDGWTPGTFVDTRCRAGMRTTTSCCEGEVEGEVEGRGRGFKSTRNVMLGCENKNTSHLYVCFFCFVHGFVVILIAFDQSGVLTRVHLASRLHTLVFDELCWHDLALY